jgi:hypothetical protein
MDRPRDRQSRKSPIPAQPGALMPLRFRASGCLASILASVVLTVLLNVLLRACSR